MANENALILDDEIDVTHALAAVFSEAGYTVSSAHNISSAKALLEKQPFDLIITDLKLKDEDGLTFIKHLQAIKSQAVIVLMSAYGTAEHALKAIKLGAHDFISKPFSPEEILFTVDKAKERERLKTENRALRTQLQKTYDFTAIIGKSAKMQEVFEKIKKVSDYKATILIEGESGTGKELVARALHYSSDRKDAKFVAVNCAAMPENLLESELFGHKRGAFTDATRDKKGLFEEASGGTLFLDEIGELPIHLQVKLLRALQESEVRPVGANTAIKVDVRVIAATLRNLLDDVQAGRFREDLYYRLNVVNITLPPLRERLDDILVLAEALLQKHRSNFGMPEARFAPEVLTAMTAYSWRGNVRELENCIEQALILSDGQVIKLEHLPLNIRYGILDVERTKVNPQVAAENLSIPEAVRKMERELITQALTVTKGNRTQAAQLLEISLKSLQNKIKDYGLDI